MGFRKGNAKIVGFSVLGASTLFVIIQILLSINPDSYSQLALLEKVISFVQDFLRMKPLFLYAVLFAVPATLIFEAWIPANSKQRLWSTNMIQDGLWLVISKLFSITLLTWYLTFLTNFYNQHLAFLTIEYLTELPKPIRIFYGILLVDFMAWLHHVVRHKVPWFWYFHEIHHSQKELNVLTDFRLHFVDTLVAGSIIVIPLLIFSYEAHQILYLAFFTMFYTQFYHGNVKMSLGPVRYILVTPQMHRIHHSLRREHQDKNFGVIFCIWDRLFGTFVDDGTYPETGISDNEFPCLKQSGVKAIAKNTVSQIVYPFQKIYRNVIGTLRSVAKIK